MPEGTVKIKENTEEELINLSYRSVQAAFSCSTGVRAIEMRSTDGGKECYLEKPGCWKSVLMCLEDSILADFCVLQSPSCFRRRISESPICRFFLLGRIFHGSCRTAYRIEVEKTKQYIGRLSLYPFLFSLGLEF